MTILYLDCFSGISGNMLLGALLDAGFPAAELRRQLAALPVNGYTLHIDKVTKCGIAATYVNVVLKDCEHEHHHTHEHDHEHHHGHTHEHEHEQHHGHTHEHEHVHHHGHTHEHGHEQHHSHTHEHGPNRNLPDILHILEHSALPAAVKADCAKVFCRLAEAEAKVHGTTADKIHFHEVGAADAIVDIVGCVLGLHYLNVSAIYTSPLHVGSGFVKCCHGLMPVPAPATAELLLGIPYYSGTIRRELVTPTGAALVAALATACSGMPAGFVSQTAAYGAGTWDLEIPNVLRLQLGTIPAEIPSLAASEALLLEANIDDMNPQNFPYVIERLLTSGVHDAWLTPIVMKKGRSAVLLSVLLPSSLKQTVEEIIFTETSTIGIRCHTVSRTTASRQLLNITLPQGTVSVKISSYNGNICSITPEFEDCRRLAQQHQLPLKTIQQLALEAALHSLN